MTTMTIPPRTSVEQWLADLGLDAAEVGACPVAECELCHPATVSAAA
jgi:hypothetical protein